MRKDEDGLTPIKSDNFVWWKFDKSGHIGFDSLQPKQISNHFFVGCYQVRNEWMVNHSNLVIAVFNGQKSGTKNTVDYAARKGISIWNVLTPSGVAQR